MSDELSDELVGFINDHWSDILRLRHVVALQRLGVAHHRQSTAEARQEVMEYLEAVECLMRIDNVAAFAWLRDVAQEAANDP